MFFNCNFIAPNNFGTWYCITVLDSICCASGVERSIARNDFNRIIKMHLAYAVRCCVLFNMRLCKRLTKR
ncbi:hypothetical protein T11_14452 [Trichinella zimbabwensis]|uniref:Uncharacterized protein n=1 Tax=Trichinella zimbabwensis TaxID=268475 RepID=A0A0V1HTA7_9BILA|nr:hypothetical protein T11_14452 [Trichinella zimbabwensis]